MMKSLMRISPKLQPEARMLYAYLSHEFQEQSVKYGEDRVIADIYTTLGSWSNLPKELQGPAELVASLMDDVIAKDWNITGTIN